MDEDRELKDLIRALIGIGGRVVFPEETLLKIVAPTKSSSKYLQAYNLFDGTRSQREIARQVGLDDGNLNKALQRWVNMGVIFKVGENMMHLYPLASNLLSSTKSLKE